MISRFWSAFCTTSSSFMVVGQQWLVIIFSLCYIIVFHRYFGLTNCKVLCSWWLGMFLRQFQITWLVSKIEGISLSHPHVVHFYPFPLENVVGVLRVYVCVCNHTLKSLKSEAPKCQILVCIFLSHSKGFLQLLTENTAPVSSCFICLMLPQSPLARKRNTETSAIKELL